MSTGLFLYLGGVESAAKAGELAFQEAPSETIWLVGALAVSITTMLVAVVGWITKHMVSRENAAQTKDIGSIKTDVKSIRATVGDLSTDLAEVRSEFSDLRAQVSFLQGVARVIEKRI